MKFGRERAWLCFKCGYAMDSYDCTNKPGAAPGEGDVSLCMNCGALHSRRADTWQPMTAAERADLTPDMRRYLLFLEFGRSLVIDEDLTKRDRHA